MVGGTCLGLQAAGFDTVVGIDIEKHKNYPGSFLQADVRHLPVDIFDFDFVWASPPCQEFSTARNGHKTPPKWGNLIPDTKKVIKGHPFTCIENLPSAPIRADITLAGPPCGLPRIRWKRIFELSFFTIYPNTFIPSRALSRAGLLVSPTRKGASNHQIMRRREAGLSSVPNLAEKKEVKGIPKHIKMTHDECGEAVPPPYAEVIGRQAIIAIQNSR